MQQQPCSAASAFALLHRGCRTAHLVLKVLCPLRWYVATTDNVQGIFALGLLLSECMRCKAEVWADVHMYMMWPMHGSFFSPIFLSKKPYMSAKFANRSNIGGQLKETSRIKAYTARPTTGEAALP